MSVMMIKDLFQFFKSAMFPCPGCGGNSGERVNSFCPECLKKLELQLPEMQCCPGCGGRMSGILGVCPQCLVEPERPWQYAYTLGAYRGGMRELIRRFKFYNTPELARPFGYLLAGKLREIEFVPDMIIPIPLHFGRQLLRGYNQSMLLAQIVGRECSIPVCDILHKTGRRSKQSKRSRQDRHRELSGSFTVTSSEMIRNKNILLLDDVFTTGATLHAAAAVLSDHAPAGIMVMTLARAVGHSQF